LTRPPHRPDQAPPTGNAPSTKHKETNMSQSTLHTIPAATITRTTAVIYGEITSDIAVHHARTSDARIGLIFGSTLMNLYSAFS
jgi:hypothetical protein